MISLLGASVIVILIFVIGGVASSFNKMDGDPDRGNKMIKAVYKYLILFITLMMMLGGSVAAFMSVTDIIAPPPYHQSFEEFKEMRKMETGLYNEKGEVLKKPEVDIDQLQNEYNRIVETNEKRAVKQATNSLLKNSGWLLVPLPVFLYFRKAIKEDSAV